MTSLGKVKVFSRETVFNPASIKDSPVNPVTTSINNCRVDGILATISDTLQQTQGPWILLQCRNPLLLGMFLPLLESTRYSRNIRTILTVKGRPSFWKYSTASCSELHKSTWLISVANSRVHDFIWMKDCSRASLTCLMTWFSKSVRFSRRSSEALADSAAAI